MTRLLAGLLVALMLVPAAGADPQPWTQLRQAPPAAFTVQLPAPIKQIEDGPVFWRWYSGVPKTCCYVFGYSTALDMSSKNVTQRQKALLQYADLLLAGPNIKVQHSNGIKFKQDPGLEVAGLMSGVAMQARIVQVTEQSRYYVLMTVGPVEDPDRFFGSLDLGH